jgi:MFS family permease
MRVPRVPRRLVVAVVLGTLLNPLNSSMIAVALTRIQGDFHVTIGEVTWLISGFYLAAAVGQPLMGRLADLFGPRRVFVTGLALVLATGLVAPLVPGLTWLVVVRAVQAIGTSAAYPAGLAMIRAATGDQPGRAPAGALGAMNVAGNVSAALGPVIGGFLVTLAGWQAIFLINVPVTVTGAFAAAVWLPADAPRHRPADRGPAGLLRLIDLGGIVLFGVTIASLLGFLLSLSARPVWVLLGCLPVAGGLLVWHEKQRLQPFLDVRMLGASPRLIGVFAQFAGVCAVFYSVFFSLPIWFEQTRGFSADQAGLLLLPVAGLGVAVTPVAATLISRAGPRPALIIGAVALTVGTLLMTLLDERTPILTLVAVGAVLGVPNAFNNLGLQAALYEATPPEHTGAAGGLFQTFRYVGAILSTSLIGLLFGTHVTSRGLHQIALAIAVASAALVIASVAARRASSAYAPGRPNA